MRPGVGGLEIRGWAGGLEVGGQGFLGEEEASGSGSSGGALGCWEPRGRAAWKMGPGLGVERP